MDRRGTGIVLHLGVREQSLVLSLVLYILHAEAQTLPPLPWANSANSWKNDPDLTEPARNRQTVLKDSYGLVVRLLYANIPVRWAISAYKSQNEPDFLAYSKKVYPLPEGSPTTASFSSGPFFVPAVYCTPPAAGGLSRADTVIQGFSSANVAVYKVLQDCVADVRYILQFKPFVGVLNDAGTIYQVHSKILDAAGFTQQTINVDTNPGQYGHYAVVNTHDPTVINSETCYTLLSEPHWEPGYAVAAEFDAKIRQFLDAGGNFLGQCAGISTYENCGVRDTKVLVEFGTVAEGKCTGVFLTMGGFMTEGKRGSGTIEYNYPWTAYGQVDSFVNTGGSIDAIDLKKYRVDNKGNVVEVDGGGWRPNTGSHFIFSELDSARASTVSYAVHGKVATRINKLGGNVFYITGHDYNGAEGGYRVYMNAVFHPAQSAIRCGFEIPPQPEETTCIDFDPYAHADYVFTPGCIPHITLDPGVGTTVKQCDAYVAMPDGWEVVDMTTTGGTTRTPTELQNVIDYGSAWLQNCFIGNNPIPGGSPAYLSYNSAGQPCSSSFTVENKLQAGTGRTCYKVSCGSSLVIRYPVAEPTCNADNYGVYCDPATGSTFYTSEYAPAPDTMYVNLAATATPLQVPLKFPLYHRVNIMVIIDTYNVIQDSSTQDSKSVALSLPYVWKYGAYKAQNVGFSYILDSNNLFSIHQSLTWSSATLASKAATFSPTKYTGNAVTGGFDSPIAASVNLALQSTSVGWFDDTPRQIWVVTKSFPRDADLALVKARMSNKNAVGYGTIVIFVTPTAAIATKIDTYFGAGFPRVGTVVSNYPLLHGQTTSKHEGLSAPFLSAIFAKAQTLVGRVEIVEVSEPHNFVTLPTSPDSGNTFIVTKLASGNPSFSTQTTPLIPDYEYYSMEPKATFLLPTGWVTSTSASLLPYIITFKVAETGHTFQTYVSWNEAPRLWAPTLSYTFKDTDGAFFLAPVVDSIRSKLDPNINLLKIAYLSQSFSPTGANWVNSMFTYGGVDDGKTWALWQSSTNSPWFNHIGLKIYPKTTPAGTMTLTYRLSDGCLTSPIGTINIEYIITNTPPVAKPLVFYINVGQTIPINFGSATQTGFVSPHTAPAISDAQTATADLKIMILGEKPAYGKLGFQTATGSYTDFQNGISPATTNDYGVQDVKYQKILFTSTALSPPDAPAVYDYRVYDAGGLFASSTITIYINKPPTIAVTPPSVLTNPGATGNWKVTISDSPLDVVNLVLVSRSVTATGQVIQSMTTTIPVGGTATNTNLLTATTGANLVSNIPLGSGTGQVSVDIPMSWIPDYDHPYGTTQILEFRAVDKGGLTSSIASVALTIPSNQPPTWTLYTPTPAPTTANTWPQDTTSIRFRIEGTDPNTGDKDFLSFAITQLPTSGTLQYVKKDGTLVTVTKDTFISYLDADQCPAMDGKTCFDFIYTPSSSVGTAILPVSDIFKGTFKDPAGLVSSPGEVPINFSIVPKPPTANSFTANAQQGQTVSLPAITGRDSNADLKKLVITNVAYAFPGNTQITLPDGRVLANGAQTTEIVLATPTSINSWVLTYLTQQYTAFTDTITYYVEDALGAKSVSYTGTIKVAAVNQRPVAYSQTYYVNEGQQINMDLIWGSRAVATGSPILDFRTATPTQNPAYFDVDGSQAASTIAFKTVPQGTLTMSGSPVTTTTSVKSATNPQLVYTAPDEVGTTELYTTFTFDVTDSPVGLTPLTSVPVGTITIVVYPVDDPPTISISPPSVVAFAGSMVKTMTVTVSDPDSDTISVRMLANSIPWPSSASVDTFSISDPSGTVTVYDGATTSIPSGTVIVANIQKGESDWPTFTITWDANGHTSSQSGAFTLEAFNTLSSNPDATATLQYTYELPAPIAPVTNDVLIVVRENQCAQGPICVSTFKAITATDESTAQLEGDSLTLNFPGTLSTSVGRLVHQTSGGVRSFATLPKSYGSNFFFSDASAEFSWTFSFESAADLNSGANCACSSGGVPITDLSTITVDNFAALCTGCGTIGSYAELPFTVTDARGGETGTATGNLYIVVLPTDYPPTSASQSLTNTRGSTLSFTIPANDRDVDVNCIEFTKIEQGDAATPATIKFTEPGQAQTGATIATGVCYTFPSSGTFDIDFTHVTQSYTGPTDRIYYKVKDAKDNYSPEYVTTIVTPRVGQAPIATGGAYTGPEDTPIVTTITWGSTPPGTDLPSYFDALPDGDIDSTFIIVTQLPPPEAGILYGPDGAPVVVGTPISANDPQFTFVPTANWNGETSFFFKSQDSDATSPLESTPVEVTLTVTPVDDPPHIEIIPQDPWKTADGSVAPDRTSTGTFIVRVWDIDSDYISVLTTFNNVPTTVEGTEWGTFTFTNGGAATVVPVPVGSTPSYTTNLMYASSADYGTKLSFEVQWTPAVAIPDGTTGTFTFRAANSDDAPPTAGSTFTPLSATFATGVVGVTPNIAPTVVEDPAYPYTFTATEGEWSGVPTDPDEHTFRLTGDDADPWHEEILDIIITEIPVGLELVYNGVVLKKGDVIPYDPTLPSDDSKTYVDVVLRDPTSTYFGTTFFEFQVRDAVGELSEPKLVPIIIEQGNRPPTSIDEKLVVFEDNCIFSSCGAPYSYGDMKNQKFVTLTATDSNGDRVWLKFDSLPPSDGTDGGQLGWFLGGPSATIAALNSLGPYTDSFAWEMWFQPSANQHSDTSPTATATTHEFGGVNYLPYSTATTFKVYDIDPTPKITSGSGTATLDDCDTASGAVLQANYPEPGRWTCTVTPDLTNHVSTATYKVAIYVIPVNDPPTSRSEVFTIKEDDYQGTGQYLEIPLAGFDIDGDNVGLKIAGVQSGSLGTFYYKNDAGQYVAYDNSGSLTVPPLTGDISQSRTIYYKPPPDTFSDPGKALATLVFQVYDDNAQSLTSVESYTVRINVLSQPDKPEWNGPKEVTILEDSEALIVLKGEDLWSSVDDGTGVYVITEVGKGTFEQCILQSDGSVKCTTINPVPGEPFVLTEGRLTYRPLPDEFGDPTKGHSYSEFTFKLYVYPGAADGKPIPADAIPETITYKINVLPVNDPPILIPRWNPATGPLVNEFDEDTYLRIWFEATDIDTPLSELFAEALLILDPFQASMYTCAGETLESDCVKPGNLVPGIGLVRKMSDAKWEVSFKSFPNWNGNLKMQFIVWDGQLSSQIRTAIIHVRPINDPPSAVKGATSITLEYYNLKKAPAAASGAAGVTEASQGGEYTLVSYTRQEVAYEIHEGDAKDERALQGKVLEKFAGDANPKRPENPNPEQKLVPIHRLRTQVQDIDFFFQYSLLLDCSLIHGTFIRPLIRGTAPCTMTHDFSLSCDAEIRALNSFLMTDGLAIHMDDESDSAIALFLVNDTGNVDKLDRPAAAGFTISFSRGEEDEPLAAPIAAVVILPIIAAATAAVIAAAWILLGQRAQDYAGASFDAFAVVSSNAGTKSPLYDDLGREVRSPLYNGGK